MTDGERQELLTLYQVTAQDLVFFKSQQWTLLNYTLLIFGAIAAISRIGELSESTSIKFILTAFALLTAVICFSLECSLYKSIEERRARLSRTYSNLSTVFQNAKGDKSQLPAKRVLGFIQVVIFVSVFLSCLIVWV